MGYSKDIQQVIIEIFEEMEWKYITNESEQKFIFNAGMELPEDVKISRIMFTLNVEEDDITIISTCDIKSDKNSKNRMTDFICRANYGLKNGNFEFDCSDGTIRYKTYIYAGERQIDKLEILNSMRVSADMWILYGNGIIDVLGSDKEPKVVIKEIEEFAYSVMDS